MNRRIRGTFLVGATLMTSIAFAPPRDADPLRLVRVDTFPRAIVLDGRFAYAQLVLTGTREDGAHVDVTRDRTVVDAAELVEVDARGLVRPLRDGDGSLQLRIAGIDVSIPVSVRGHGSPADPGFAHDVQPILTRRGCNAGTCHGAANGKNGFKLSLRGYDAESDHAALTDELAGRRFDRSAPASSLFLLKPTASVPHEGGKVLGTDEPDYELLRAWVAGGVRLRADAPKVVSIELFPKDPTIAEPGSEQQFAVLARYDDGSQRDVTAHSFVETGNVEVVEVTGRGLIRTLRRGEASILARFEGRYAATRLFVMGDRSGFEWVDVPESSYVDELVDARLREIRTQPSGTCTDAEFLRRVHLDLTGLLPTRQQVAAFDLDSRDATTKRDEVVDRLIGSSEFVEHWTNRWCDLLQVNAKFLGTSGARAMRGWIRRSVASNQPYDEFVRALLASSGSTIENPPAAYYKVLRAPDVAMENSTQLFLGVRFNCNKCHDHPFERWTQRQHWELAAMFADVRRADVEGSPRMPSSTVMDGATPPTEEELISDASDGTVHDPNGREYGPQFPYQHAGGVPDEGVRRARLAAWMTAKENPYFARSYVNRLWSYLLGIGLIEPVDDIRAGNPASHPELLDRLAAEFVESGFDMRAVLRRICTSQTYQRSIESGPWNADDDDHFAKARARRLPAEVLFDAVHQAVGARANLPGVRPGTPARDLVDSSIETRDGFLDLFGRPPRESACECERSVGMSLGQALNLVNGPTLADAIRDPGNEINELVTFESDAGRIVDELFVRFLSRSPTAAERAELASSFDPLDLRNLDALSEADAAEFSRRQASWEGGLSVPEWHVVQPGNVRSEAGTPLRIAEDGSVIAGGEGSPTEVYEFVGRTELARISGVRIEVLPDMAFPKNGPGRAESGNFVLANLAGSAIPLRDVGKAAPLQFTAATADFSQNDWPVARAIVDDSKGWGIHPNAGVAHEAVFELGADVGAPGGTLVSLRMTMPYGSHHVIGRFRVSVTDAPRPVRFSMVPPDVAAALRVSPPDRDAAQQAVAHRAFAATDAELRDKIRRGAAQDLAWALATSPAFLFNR